MANLLTAEELRGYLRTLRIAMLSGLLSVQYKGRIETFQNYASMERAYQAGMAELGEVEGTDSTQTRMVQTYMDDENDESS